FRAAIQLQFDFHRAIYNLGIVLLKYSQASKKMHQKAVMLFYILKTELLIQ
ncbi:hypothetical protein S83_011986, partial [Arachis hypogaea]